MTQFYHQRQKEVEETVLAAALSERDATRMVLEKIKDADVFHDPGYQHIFRAIRKLFEQGKAIDILTVTHQLLADGTLEKAGGAYEVSRLPSLVNSAANLESHLAILFEGYVRRQLLAMSGSIQLQAANPTSDVFDLVNEISKGLSLTLDNIISKQPVFLAQAYAETINQIQSGIGKGGLVGVPSGIASIDKLTGGWQKNNLIIIAARPGMGKTAAAIQFAKNAAIRYNKRVALFSLEMSIPQLVYRLIASESEATNSELSKSMLSMDDLEEVTIMSQCLQNNNLILDDTPGLSILELRTKALKLKADHDIELLIVDYLQLMRGDRDGNREQEISSISRGLKLIAKELDIPVIALSQLSRAVETRGGDKKPQLSDLRESGSIEQDADTVIFLYRPEYYDITEDQGGNSTAGVLQHIFAKHRNGPLDTIYTKCDLAHSSITDFQTQRSYTPLHPTF